jgi:hypothetical protein
LLWTYHKGKIWEDKSKVRMTHGKIYHTNGLGSTFIVHYEYVVEMQVFKSSKKVAPVQCYDQIPFNKYFPILYILDAPNINQPLLRRESVKEYYGTIPDSLQWMKDCW